MATETARAYALGLFAGYPGRQIGEMNVEAIAHALDQFDVGIAAEVCKLLQRRSADPPSVAQVYEAAREITQQTSSPSTGRRSRGVPLPLRPVRTTVVEGMRINADWLAWRESLKRAERPKREGPPPPSCAGTNSAPIHKDGKWVCPGCGVEVR